MYHKKKPLTCDFLVAKSCGIKAGKCQFNAIVTATAQPSVYGFENEISQIAALLKSEYNVWNSHLGTIRVNPNLSNLENCLKAVEDCDLFLGIIRTQCGTGYIGDKNITFEEMNSSDDTG